MQHWQKMCPKMNGEAQLKFTRSYKKVCNFVQKCKKLGLSTKVTDTDP